jgi:hypothetical protein
VRSAVTSPDGWAPAEVVVPSLPPTTPTLLPKPRPVARRASSQFAIAGGAFVALLVVVVLVFALPARGAKSNPPRVDVGNSAAQLDLRNLAAAEETNLTATTKYTADTAALEAVGYAPTPGAPAIVRAGIHAKKAYCLVASGVPSSRWYLYDSKQGGLVSVSFPSESAAELACVDRKITSYATVT